MSTPITPITFHSDTSPFVIEHLRLDERPDRSDFTPGVRLLVTRALRTSGLLQVLPESELKSFLFLLTFLTANGYCHATAPQLAAAMATAEAKVRVRMERLTAFTWQGQPLVQEIRRESGLDGYVPSPTVVSSAAALESPLAPPQSLLPPAAGREAVYAFSREMYATPRQEVERSVAEQLGHVEEVGDGLEVEVRRKLRALGVLKEQADLLLANHSLEEIKQQVEWLPYRSAKSPARFLVAAIQGNYAPPASVRLEKAMGEEGVGESAEQQG